MRRFFKLLLYLIGIAAVVVVAASGLTFYYVRSMGRKYSPRSGANEPPLFLPVKHLRLTMSDGAVLQGWLLHHEQDEPLVWIIPDLEEFTVDWAPLMSAVHDWGYAVAAVNLRGHTPSEGKFVPGERLVQDVREILRHLLNMSSLERRWAILGHGMGAVLAMRSLCENPPVRLLVLEDPVTTFTERLMLPIDRRWRIGLMRTEPWWRWHYQKVYHEQDKTASAVDCFRRYGQDKPSTVILQSHVVPGEFVKATYQAVPEPKELIPIPLPATASLGESEMNRYQRMLKTFLDKHLPPVAKTIELH